MIKKIFCKYAQCLFQYFWHFGAALSTWSNIVKSYISRGADYTVRGGLFWHRATTVMQHYSSLEDHFLWAYLRLPLISVFAEGCLIGVLNWLAFGNLIGYLIDVTTLLSVYYNLIALCSITWLST